MERDGKIVFAVTQSGKAITMEPGKANRHGLLTGATGTGKSVSLKALAEAFSEMGVPVFLADIKGDLNGLAVTGATLNDKFMDRIKSAGIDDYENEGFPVRFWDVLGTQGIPVRVTVSEMGPILISRLLELTEAQAGVLNIVFRVADDEGLLLLDLKDLRSMVNYVGENAKEYQTSYGNVSGQTIGAIQRKLLTLEDQGADIFFGEPALDISEWFATKDGKGIINILECSELIKTPILYSTFLLWMLTEIYETMPEVGDLDKPKMVFFFDEAHLLFNDAPKALVEKVEQVARLIRSKGVGLFFITQSPADIPDTVLAQLGNKIQHALRAFTPKEQKAIKAAAASFRPNPEFDTETAIGELGTGEALVSCLDEDGRPTVVERAFILAPKSSMSAADPGIVTGILNGDPLLKEYKEMIDRESAYEKLVTKAESDKVAAEHEAEMAAKEKELEKAQKEAEKAKKEAEKAREKAFGSVVRKVTGSGGRARKSAGEKMVDTAMTTIGRQAGNAIFRGIMGMMKK